MNNSFSSKFIDRYIITASSYSVIRKIAVLKKHKIECVNSNTTANKQYRDVLLSEMVPLSIIAGVVGVYLAPIHIIFHDVKNLEISTKGLNPNNYINTDDYLHGNAFDLLLV